MERVRAEVAVVGLGAFGASALWRLAARGVRVVGLERHGIAHELGSSHGVTRLFRVACMEHPGLPPVALRSLDLWRSLEAEGAGPLVHRTGCLHVGAPDSRPVRGSRAAADAAGLTVEELAPDQLRRAYPHFAGLAPTDVGVLDGAAGVCYPERILHASVDAARRLGADVRTQTRVGYVEPDADGVTVHAEGLELRADTVVLAGGARLHELLPAPGPTLPLVPRPTPLTWFTPAPGAPHDFDLAHLPAFVWERPDGHHLWGHGSAREPLAHQVKVGVHEVADTTPLPWEPDEGQLAAAAEALAPHLAAAFPDLTPHPTRIDPCVVTDSPDGQFLVGRLPGLPHTLVAGGDSGQGFKHAGGIGELLAQLTLDEPLYCDAGFMDPGRFVGR